MKNIIIIRAFPTQSDHVVLNDDGIIQIITLANDWYFPIAQIALACHIITKWLSVDYVHLIIHPKSIIKLAHIISENMITFQ
jgi:hypothetical protein